uniref:hypothetical protein n=1 Tax=uncultured Caulobacter sp. TaxID=158749 RepID=UPI0025DB4372|nr:hypothetical protein [uncultured Caulobacter sp.]
MTSDRSSMNALPAIAISRRSLFAAGLAAGAAVGPGGMAIAASSPAMSIAATPNPHVFPLVLAMSLNPSLPVKLLAVAESREFDSLLASGQADALLAMTYIAAQKRGSGAVDDLRLHTITTWRGFFQVAAEDVRTLRDLKGRTTIVSGPVGPGRGGGGDLIFQAAARRQGLDPSRDMYVEYVPVAQGAMRVLAGQAAAITIPSPGSTGLVLRSGMRPPASPGLGASADGKPIGAPSPRLIAIDLQAVFSGYRSFPAGQLPLGGFHATERMLADAQKRRTLDRITQAYGDAAEKLTAEPDRYAPIVATAYSRFFGHIGAGNPSGTLLARSLTAGDLVYRTARPTKADGKDLAAFLGEILGKPVPAEFLAGGG